MHDIIWEGETTYGYYQVVDTIYGKRPARMLYSGERRTAQSGVAKDDNPDLLFDYNQRMLELATSVAPERILLIGGAVETLPKALLEVLPDTRIDVVEPDDGLTDLAYRFFDLPIDERLHIYHTDGRSFLDSNSNHYDLVLVDAFVHNAIPYELRTMQAFMRYAEHLRPNGILMMNVISAYHGNTSRMLREICATALHSLSMVEVFLAGHGYSLWLPQNFILTAQCKGGKSLKEYMRYEAVELPKPTLDDVLYDV
jgi:spermidine synthase